MLIHPSACIFAEISERKISSSVWAVKPNDRAQKRENVLKIFFVKKKKKNFEFRSSALKMGKRTKIGLPVQVPFSFLLFNEGQWIDLIAYNKPNQTIQTPTKSLRSYKSSLLPTILLNARR